MGKSLVVFFGVIFIIGISLSLLGIDDIVWWKISWLQFMNTWVPAGLIGLTVESKSIIAGFFNPEYGAIKDIIKFIK
jgi:hypothetical protein